MAAAAAKDADSKAAAAGAAATPESADAAATTATTGVVGKVASKLMESEGTAPVIPFPAPKHPYGEDTLAAIQKRMQRAFMVSRALTWVFLGAIALFCFPVLWSTRGEMQQLMNEASLARGADGGKPGAAAGITQAERASAISMGEDAKKN
jgi:hypothetical protein